MSASLRCDGHDNCLDGSDEVSFCRCCSPRIRKGLDETVFKDSEWEGLVVAVYPLQIGCVKECREDEFLCLNRAHCIPRRWRCDDVLDCMDHSDEENCDQGASRPKQKTAAVKLMSVKGLNHPGHL